MVAVLFPLTELGAEATWYSGYQSFNQPMMWALGKRAHATQKAGTKDTCLLGFACAFEPLDALAW